jgi:tight adherence protein B
MTTFTTMDKLAVLLAGLCAFAAVWAIGDLVSRFLQEWQRRYVERTEAEMQEMLLQTPAAKLFRWVMAGAGLVAFLTFGAVSTAGRGWNWQSGAIMAVLVFLMLVATSRVIMTLLRKRRLERFNDQLEEALMSMSNSLKAGFSITQAIDLVIRQGHQPIAIEFRLMIQQTQLGMTFDDALRNMADRVNSEDFRLVASAISTARLTGGDLTGIFDRLAALIRERLRIQRRIRSLSAQGRLQGWVLGSLPLLLLAVLFMLDPKMVIGFFSQPLGIVLFLIVLALEFAGFWTIKKIVTIDI